MDVEHMKRSKLITQQKGMDIHCNKCIKSVFIIITINITNYNHPWKKSVGVTK